MGRVDAASEGLRLEGDPAGAVQLGALHLRVAGVVAPIAQVVALVVDVVDRLARLALGEVVPDVSILRAHLARVAPHLRLRLSELDLPLAQLSRDQRPQLSIPGREVRPV